MDPKLNYPTPKNTNRNKNKPKLRKLTLIALTVET